MPNIVKTKPVLPTFDPNWQAKQDDILRQIQELNQELENPSLSPESRLAKECSQSQLTYSLSEVFHAQFRTADDYKAWVLEKLEEKAQAECKFLALPELPEDASVAQIRDWQRRGYDMLREQGYPKLPVGQPDGVDGFGADVPAGSQRSSFHLSYEGIRGFPSEVRCTLEQTPQKVLVCFHHIPDSTGTSPTNAVETLATGIKQEFLPNHTPESISFFIHIPAAVGGHCPGEAFQKVDMTWTPQGYASPRWTYYKQIPPAIRAAEIAPYDPPPIPEKHSSLIPITPARPGNKGSSTVGKWLGKLIK